MTRRGIRRTRELATREPVHFSAYTQIAACMVLFVQLCLPLAPLFAADEAEAQIVSVTEEVVETTEAREEVVLEPEVTSTPQASLEPESIDEPEPVPIEDNETDVVSDDVGGVVPDPGSISNSEAIEGTTSTSSAPIDVEESPLPEIIPEDTVVDVPPLIPEEDIEEVPLQEEEEEDITASSSEEILPVEVHTVTNDKNKFSFGVNDCAQVADGSFYCQKAAEEPVPILTDRVFAGPDADGDNEIFIEHDGELLQITHNLIDDDAPYYDSESNTIVWHRMVDERYQIISYAVEEEKETILTRDHFNNMQPTRTGDVTVWQGWVGNDWDILLMEGKEILMLTDNTVHDIGPRINGDYVIWQAEETDGWKVRVYNRLTKQTETISDTDGASIENPRLVLLYDAKQENGDVETRGYDLVSGETVPLGALPGTIPDIPDPDQTGEDRALISTGNQLKTKTEDDSDPQGDGSTTTPPIDGGVEPGVIVIPPFGEATSTENGAVSTTTEVADLVILPIPVASSTVPLEDLVIPSFPSESDVEIDSQEEVAS
jgi:hypothetical protein